MKKKAKEKKGLFENMEFNSAQYAHDVAEEMETKAKKAKRALPIAAVGSICGVLGLAMDIDTSGGFLLVVAAFLIAIVSYVLGGGILVGVKWVWRITVFGWFIIPVFPIDIVVGIFALIIALYGLCLFPIIAVSLNYRQLCKNREDALTYLKYCQPAAGGAEVI